MVVRSDRIRARERKYYQLNKEKIIARRHEYYQRNKNNILAQKKEYVSINIDAVRKRQAKYCLQRRRTDPQYKLKIRVAGLVKNCLIKQKKSKILVKLLDYTPQELRAHFESKFKKGMTWENYGRHGWQIDHIKPQKLFKYNSTEDGQFQECWALHNLQPLWAEENKLKRDTY